MEIAIEVVEKSPSCCWFAFNLSKKLLLISNHVNSLVVPKKNYRLSREIETSLIFPESVWKF